MCQALCRVLGTLPVTVLSSGAEVCGDESNQINTQIEHLYMSGSDWKETQDDRALREGVGAGGGGGDSLSISHSLSLPPLLCSVLGGGYGAPEAALGTTNTQE